MCRVRSVGEVGDFELAAGVVERGDPTGDGRGDFIKMINKRKLGWPEGAGATCRSYSSAIWQLVVNRAAKTEQVSAVIGNLEGPESIAGVGQFPKHGNPFGYELCV